MLIIKLLLCILPWKLRRFLLIKIFGYEIDPKAKIGLSYIYPDKLVMKRGAYIGHLNVAIHLHAIVMDENSCIVQQNWITGFPLKDQTYFAAYTNRSPELFMGKEAAISKKHLIDCTDKVSIGAYTSIGGYNTQILTHSTSLEKNDQSCAPIIIGHHCFIGTRSIILPGSVLPNQSVLGAGALLQKKFTEPFSLYGGVPAKFIKKVNENYLFFYRTFRPKSMDEMK